MGAAGVGVSDDGFDEFLSESGSDSGEVLQFDQEQLASEEISPAKDEVLEFNQEELILEQESTSVPTEEPVAEPLPVDVGNLDGSNVSGDVGDLDGTGVTDLTGFVLEQWQASLALIMAAIVGFIALNLIRGNQGRTWKAVRDDPVAASLVGISTKSNKVSAFVISGFFAALAGAVMAQIFSYVGPALFGLTLSLSLLVGVILGGRASLIGAMVGAAFIVVLPKAMESFAEQLGWSDQVAGNLPDLVYGLLVVLVVLVLPGGLVGSLISAIRRRT
jgi:hypothetical protein